MPRQLKEIRDFSSGTVLNISERDIPENASAYSLNINPLEESGILNSIKNDKLFFSSDNSEVHMLTPVSWGSSGVNSATFNPPEDESAFVIVDNINKFNGKFHFIM